MLNWILSLFEGSAEDDEAVSLFLAGHSVLKTAALLNPGVGGPALEQRQRAVEDDLRAYVAELSETIAQLRATAA